MTVYCYHTPENNLFTEGLKYKAKRINEKSIEIIDNLGHTRFASRQFRHGIGKSEYYTFPVVDGPFSDFNMARFNILCE